METHRRTLPETDAKKSAELAVYFTHCQMQPAHLQLSLRSAMTILYKSKNYATSSLMARRLIELSPPANIVETVRSQAV